MSKHKLSSVPTPIECHKQSISHRDLEWPTATKLLHSKSQAFPKKLRCCCCSRRNYCIQSGPVHCQSLSVRTFMSQLRWNDAGKLLYVLHWGDLEESLTDREFDCRLKLSFCHRNLLGRRDTLRSRTSEDMAKSWNFSPFLNNGHPASFLKDVERPCSSKTVLKFWYRKTA